MSKSDKFLGAVLQLVEAGILSSEDLKKEFNTFLKFQRDNIMNRLNLVSREEFEIQKAIIYKLQKKIDQLKIKKKSKKTK